MGTFCYSRGAQRNGKLTKVELKKEKGKQPTVPTPKGWGEGRYV